MLELKDMTEDSWVAIQSLTSGGEIEVYLPYTTQVRITKARRFSTTKKAYTVSMINVYSVGVDAYLTKYLNSTTYLKVHSRAMIILGAACDCPTSWVHAK